MNEAAQGLERLRVEAQSLPTALRAHTGRVVAEARRLARHYALDTARVEAAAWGHDLFRGHADDALLQAAAKLGIEAGSTARVRPILLHGPVAAATAEEHWGVNDGEVLEAIRWHTTARPEMSLFAAAVFLADKIEPEKVAGDAELAAIRELAPRGGGGPTGRRARLPEPADGATLTGRAGYPPRERRGAECATASRFPIRRSTGWSCRSGFAHPGIINRISGAKRLILTTVSVPSGAT